MTIPWLDRLTLELGQASMCVGVRVMCSEEGHQARWRWSRGFEDIFIKVLIRMGVMLGRCCAVGMAMVVVMMMVVVVVVVRCSGVAR